MNRTNRFLSVLNIEPGEGRVVGLLIAFYFMIGIGFNFIQTAAFTLFLTEYTAAHLSYIYIINAVFVTLLTTAYLRLGKRVAFTRLLLVNLLFLFALVLLSRFGLALPGSRTVVFLLPVLFQVVINFGNLAFWPLAARLFNVRQSKRLFGMVGSGQWIAIVLTGFVMGPLAARIGTPNLLLLAAAGLAGAVLLLRVIARATAGQVEPPAVPTMSSTAPRASLFTLLRSRYILLIFSLVVVWWVAFFLLDNLFYDRAAVRYSDPAQLAGFLGVYLSGLGILTLIFNFFIAGRVISRFGLRASLLILPALLALTTGALAVTGLGGAGVAVLFGLTIVTKLTDMVFGFSIDRSVQAVLYQPLPVPQRGETQAVAEGVVQPLANGLTGLILLGLAALFSAGALPLILASFAVALLWLIIAFSVGKEYPAMLVKALARRRLDGASIQLGDASSLAVLREHLADPHPGPVLYAIQILSETDPAALADSLPDLIHHPAPEVRAEAFRLIEQLERREVVPSLRVQLNSEPDLTARQAGIRTLLSLGDPQDLEQASMYLEHPAAQIRKGAVVGLIRSRGIEGVLMAGQALLNLVESPRPYERSLAAGIFGELGIKQYHQTLIKLLQDSNLSVRRSALRAVGQIQAESLWPAVIAALRNPKTRSAAMTALAMGGSSALEPLYAHATQPDVAPDLLRAAIQISGRVGSPPAVVFLKQQMTGPDLQMRGEALRVLAHVDHPIEPGERAVLEDMLRSEAAHRHWIHDILNKLNGNPSNSVLVFALHNQIFRLRERVILLLALLYDRRTMLRAHENLRLASPEKRAYALEIIDLHLPQYLKSVVMPVFEDTGRSTDIKIGAPEPIDPACLVEIITRPLDWNTPWTVAAGLYLARGVDHPALVDAVQELSRSNWPIIAELARRVLQISPLGEEKIMLSTVEKVLALKKVALFSETPDDVLVEVAQVLEEQEFQAEEIIFEKDAVGSSMYIITAGKVRVYDGQRTLNHLEIGDVFGEMALLDPQPRSASVAAVEDSLLLRMDQEPMYELIDIRPEVSRGIIQVLTRHLRSRMQDLDRMQNLLEKPVQA